MGGDAASGTSQAGLGRVPRIVAEVDDETTGLALVENIQRRPFPPGNEEEGYLMLGSGSPSAA